ncbi:hypothetical protein ASA1KI_02170 [Opitutales bacterium ASA1]|uniref:DUF167 domain-containing protein n=1 Tax=Congregicoccus parvus TaxID=3081749 RepID=UPI002B2DA77E|nr:hypothetical protein ASA1KI_02170 [Opitutales bacterium ASA1]
MSKARAARSAAPAVAATASTAAPACRVLFKVTPGAPRDEVLGAHGDAVRIKLRAPPVDGRANAALLAFLADRLDLRTDALRIVTGETARTKLVSVSGLAEDEVRSRLSFTQ